MTVVTKDSDYDDDMIADNNESNTVDAVLPTVRCDSDHSGVCSG